MAVMDWAGLVKDLAPQFGLDPNIVLNLIGVESSGNPSARSPAGAIGLMQVMPFHVKEGQNLYDPVTNLKVGMEYLGDLLNRYGNYNQALQAYFGGPGNVGKSVTDILGMSPQKYAQKVLGNGAAYNYGDTDPLHANPEEYRQRGLPYDPDPLHLQKRLAGELPWNEPETEYTGSIVDVAKRFFGTPYVWGAGRTGDTNAFDCSSFVSKVYNLASGGKVNLTPYTDAMFEQTTPVSKPLPGDLVFYQGYDPSQPNTRFPHVGIYAGGNNIIDASSGTGKVSMRPMNIPGYTPVFRRASEELTGFATDLVGPFVGEAPDNPLSLAIKQAMGYVKQTFNQIFNQQRFGMPIPGSLAMWQDRNGSNRYGGLVVGVDKDVPLILSPTVNGTFGLFRPDVQDLYNLSYVGLF